MRHTHSLTMVIIMVFPVPGLIVGLGCGEFPAFTHEPHLAHDHVNQFPQILSSMNSCSFTTSVFSKTPRFLWVILSYTWMYDPVHKWLYSR